jgi:hypothetical protein
MLSRQSWLGDQSHKFVSGRLSRMTLGIGSMQTTARRNQLHGKVNGPWGEKSANECDHFHHFHVVVCIEIGETMRTVLGAGLLSQQDNATKR